MTNLKEIPQEILNRMMECQEEQGNKRDLKVFEKYLQSGKARGGFDWDKTKEGQVFWENLLINNQYHLFFEQAKPLL